MALVLPVLMMLAFGVVEYGYFFFVKNALISAARNGIREAVESDATFATTKAEVDASMTMSGLQGCGYTVSSSPSNLTGLPTGQPITLTVTCTWANAGVHVLPAWLGGISNSKQITASVMMNRE